MPRLRTTTTLSVLALAIGIVGTGWLSTLTSVWHVQHADLATVSRQPSSRIQTRHPARHHAQVSVVMPHRYTLSELPQVEAGDVQAAIVEPPVELIPLTTPSDNSQPWYQLQGHLDGHVVVRLSVDGSGRVITAAMRQSSGDPILDDHALRSVHLWRFAVPSDHPDGVSGELPMQFATRG